MNRSKTLVLDTHALLWYLENSRSLSRNARQAFDEIHRGRYTGVIPTIVLAEAMYLSERRRTTLTFGQVRASIAGSANYETADLNLDILDRMQSLTTLDIHDRIIVATALSRGARLITKDLAIRNSGVVECIW